MKTIPLTQGYKALVDDEDYEELSKHEWCIILPTLRVVRYYGISMSREIMKAPPYLDVDHRNGNRLDMQKFNLRICNRSQNVQNSRKRKSTSSKYKGVCFVYKSWRTDICFRDIFGQQVRLRLGHFSSEEEAARAYDDEARKKFGEFAALNFPGEGERSCL